MQVLAQPIFSVVESHARRRWPESKFVMEEYPVVVGIGINGNGNGNGNSMMSINLLRLSWRSLFVGFVTLVAMAFPFFNELLGFLGAISYWPLTVYFPVKMYIAQNKITPTTTTTTTSFSIRWFGLQILNFVCLLVALASLCGSLQGFVQALRII